MREAIERDKILNLVKDLRAENKTIVVTNGCFDILHVGHVRYLEETKKFGDILIVALNSDKSVKRIKGEDRPINGEEDRAEVLLGLKSVDYVVLFDETSPGELIAAICPDVYTKGADYSAATLPEAEIMKKCGIRTEFIKLVDGKSTTSTLEKISGLK